MGAIDPGDLIEDDGGHLDRPTDPLRVLWLIPILLAGAAVAIARAPLASWMHGLVRAGGPRGNPGRIRRALAGSSLGALRAAIVGNTKEAVASVFGPPRTSAVQVTRRGKQSDAGGETWYYLLDRQDRSAMAIRFSDGRAERVEFIRSPVT